MMRERFDMRTFSMLWFGVAAAAVIAAGCASLAPRTRAVLPSAEASGVRFRYFAPSAHRVQLAGSWPENNWARGDGPVGEADIGLMSDDDGDGMWEVVVALPAGRHQYLFWIDEAQWSLDPGNPEEVNAGPQGRASEIVLVSRDGRLEVR
jgi:1,4-alpha-glucan branching enzyme